MRSAVVAGVQQTTFVDIQMNDGAVTEAVEVTGANPELQVNTSSLRQVINNQQISELPLVGRNGWRTAHGCFLRHSRAHERL